MSSLDHKRVVHYFVSYTRDDDKIPDTLLRELGKQLSASRSYDFRLWRDTNILIGKDWDTEIKVALAECDFGLLLVSPAFLGKKYITTQELPVFVQGKKPCVPVPLCRIDFEEQDLKGLEPTQFFSFTPPRDSQPRSFKECSSGKHREAFVHKLFKDITARLDDFFANEGPQSSASSKIESGFDESAYRAHIRRHYQHLQLEALGGERFYRDIEFQQVFIPQDARDCSEWPPQALEAPASLTLEEVDDSYPELYDQKRFRDTAPRGILDLLDDPAVRHRVILGAPGAGKSSLTRIRLLTWAEAPKDRKLPVLIELRRFHRSGSQDFLDYLGLNKELLFHFPPQALRTRLEDGTADLIFDGLDEILEYDIRQSIARQIVCYAERFPMAQILVTSRIVGYPGGILRNADFAHWLLADFDDNKVSAFLDHWTTDAIREPGDRAIVHQRMQDALRSPVIAELAGNPLLLTLMAVLARNSDLPRDLGSLYARATTLLLEQWDTHRTLASDVALGGVLIDQTDKHDLLRDLAWKMQTGQRGLRGNLISEDEVRAAMDTAFTNRIPDPGVRRKAISLLIEKLIERNYILCHVGGGQFAFVHRGFLEFFCAEKIRQLCAEAADSPLDTAVKIFVERVNSDAWIEILALASVSLPALVADRALFEMVKRFRERLMQDRTSIERLDALGRPVYEEEGHLLLAVKALRQSRDRSGLPRTDNLVREILESELESVTDLSFRIRCLRYAGWLGDERLTLLIEDIMRTGVGTRPSSVSVAFWALAMIRPDRRTLLLGRAALYLPMNGTFSNAWIRSIQQTMMSAPFPKNDLERILDGLTDNPDPYIAEWAGLELQKMALTRRPRLLNAQFSNGEAVFACVYQMWKSNAIRGEG